MTFNKFRLKYRSIECRKLLESFEQKELKLFGRQDQISHNVNKDDMIS